jgi:hypothetical protein
LPPPHKIVLLKTTNELTGKQGHVGQPTAIINGTIYTINLHNLTPGAMEYILVTIAVMLICIATLARQNKNTY